MYSKQVFTYNIKFIQRPAFGSIHETLIQVEMQLNRDAQQGWELDKIMPIELGGQTNGAILVMRKSLSNNIPATEVS